RARALVIGLGVVIAAAGGGWALRRVLAPPPTAAVALDVIPPGADLTLDGAATAERAFRLKPGSTHELRARARGYLPGALRFTATPGAELALALRHTLPAVGERDLAALPAELPAPAGKSFAEVDRDLQVVDLH